jgi:hypothetical protein
MPAVEPGEVDLDLEGATGQRGDRGEILAGEVSQLIDQGGQLRDRQRFHAFFGSRDRCSVAWQEVLAPVPLQGRNAVPNGRREQARNTARVANQVPEHPWQVASEDSSGEPVDRVVVPAVDDDVVRARIALSEQLLEENVQAVLHGCQQP